MLFALKVPTEGFDRHRSMVARVEDAGYSSFDSSPGSPVLCNRNRRLGPPLNASSRWCPFSLLFSAFGTGILYENLDHGCFRFK
jgi:hypothetical protein